jgi:hypothetical protein
MEDGPTTPLGHQPFRIPWLLDKILPWNKKDIVIKSRSSIDITNSSRLDCKTQPQNPERNNWRHFLVSVVPIFFDVRNPTLIFFQTVRNQLIIKGLNFAGSAG